MSLTADERETILNMDDGSDTALIYTAQRTVISKLKKNPAAELIREGKFEGTAFAEFRLPANLVSFRRPMKLKDSERARRADTLIHWKDDPDSGLDTVGPDA
jgi:hypothetical protein